MKMKNEEIEYLRAVAVLMTLVHHTQLLIRWKSDPLGIVGSHFGFWGGVDLFFCISGYVVSKSFIEAFDRARLTNTHWHAARAFWVRRAYRLLPSSWLWAAIPIPLAIYLNQTVLFTDAPNALRSALSIVLLSSNLVEHFGIPLAPNYAYWSLSLEEQFYFLFPFFLLLIPTSWRWKTLLFAIAIQFPLMRNYPDLLWYTRLDALMWGIIIYVFSRTTTYSSIELRFRKSKPTMIAASALLVVSLSAISEMLMKLPFHLGLMAATCAALVWLASYDKGYVLPFRRLRPIALWIGSRSYAIYLCHVPIFFATNEIWLRWTQHEGLPPPNGTYTVRFVVTALALIVVFSELNYRLIETPFRIKGARAAKKIAQSSSSVPEVA